VRIVIECDKWEGLSESNKEKINELMLQGIKIDNAIYQILTELIVNSINNFKIEGVNISGNIEK
jgi:hypothetical protein